MKKHVIVITILLVILFKFICPLHAENGYKTWLRYEKIDDAEIQLIHTFSDCQI
jgi:hypothetical protein